MGSERLVFSGSAHPALAAAIARELGVPLGSCSVSRFPDGELTVRLEVSVRGQEVFVVQPTSPPVNDNLVELLAFADACRRAAAARVTAVVPYFGYARADKRTGNREPITASMVATILQAVGVHHLLTMDLHTPQVEGFFHIPVDTLTAVPPLCGVLRQRLPGNVVVVSPDAGRVKLATEYARRLGAPLAVLHKERGSGSETRVNQIVGDVRGRRCLLVDDMISTGGTIVKSAEALRDAGAEPEITVVATHALLIDDAVDRLADHGVGELVITDTVPARHAVRPRVTVVSVAPLLAEAVRRLHTGASLMDLC